MHLTPNIRILLLMHFTICFTRPKLDWEFQAAMKYLKIMSMTAWDFFGHWYQHMDACSAAHMALAICFASKLVPGTGYMCWLPKCMSVWLGRSHVSCRHLQVLGDKTSVNVVFEGRCAQPIPTTIRSFDQLLFDLNFVCLFHLVKLWNYLWWTE